MTVSFFKHHKYIDFCFLPFVLFKLTIRLENKLEQSETTAAA
jgi:hypothetical protein